MKQWILISISFFSLRHVAFSAYIAYCIDHDQLLRTMIDESFQTAAAAALTIAQKFVSLS